MSNIHMIKLKPGSKDEARFIDILVNAGVHMDLVLCRRWDVFGTEYNEYILSGSLYNLICDNLSGVKFWKEEKKDGRRFW